MRNPAPELPPELQALVREEVRRALEEERAKTNRATIVVFSGEIDRVTASLVLATGAAAMGMEVTLLFTFWGLSAIKRGRRLRGKKALEKALALLTPAGLSKLGMSKLQAGGLGPKVLRRLMKTNGVSTPEELFAMAREAGVKLVGCTLAMEVLGLEREDLIEGVELGGVAAYLGDASQSRFTLFI